MTERTMSDAEVTDCAQQFPPEGSEPAPDAARSSLPGVYIKTFGCQMNEYDTEKMLAMLSKDHRIVSSPEQAQVVIVNTCSVREKGEHKLFSFLGKLSLLKQDRPDMVLGVSGCVAQQEGGGIIKRNKSVDFVIGTHNLSLVPELVKRAKQGADPAVAVDYREEWEELPDEFNALQPQDVEHTSTQSVLNSAFFSPVRALVSIQRGCNKHCAFCVVPTTRGPQVSRAVAEILKEIRIKVRLGAREVMLLGQTVNSYGLDLAPRIKFEDLIEEIAAIDGVKRIRFTSPHPAEVRRGFIDLYGRIPQLVPHIHLPLQSGSDRILKLMNRNYRKERYLEIVSELRAKVPDLCVTTDLIIGFPTETEQEFEESLDMMRQVRYSMCFSFKYSRRPNTRANQEFTLDQEVDEETAHRRLLKQQALQNEISRDVNQQFVGQTVEVLVEQAGKTLPLTVKGRIPQNTPIEVDLEGRVAKVGEILAASVIHATPYGLRGKAV